MKVSNLLGSLIFASSDRQRYIAERWTSRTISISDVNWNVIVFFSLLSNPLSRTHYIQPGFMKHCHEKSIDIARMQLAFIQIEIFIIFINMCVHVCIYIIEKYKNKRKRYSVYKFYIKIVNFITA